MSRFRWNLASNFAASIWIAIVQFACVPVYVHLLGVEAYGLIGFHVMLVAVLQILDLGLSPTMNREMARRSVLQAESTLTGDFARTMEVGYWALGFVLGAAVVALAPAIVGSWIRPGDTQREVAEHAVAMMGVLVGLQWPLSFYQSGLRGLQKQVSLNVVRIVAISLANGGAVLALIGVSRSVETYFLWQMVVMALQVAVMRQIFWRSVPSGARGPRFDLRSVAGAMEFTRGMMGIAVCGVILGQMDKVVVSRAVTLEMFGYYAIASTAASGLTAVTSPLFSAVFPRLSALVAGGDEPAIRQTYHFGTQLLACLMMPAMLMLVLFPGDIILAWTRNADAANHSALLLQFLAVGTAINGMMHMPYGLQLSSGWTSIALRLAIANAVIFLPLAIIGVALYGAPGGAASWALLNLGYLAVGIPLTHRRLLKGEAAEWLLRDLGRPLVAAALVVVVARLASLGSPAPHGAIGAVLILLCIAGVASAAAMLAAPLVRSQLVAGGQWLKRRVAGSVR